MIIMPVGEFRKLTVQQLKENMPIMVTADGEPLFLVDAPDKVVILSDLHPRVQNMFRAMEKKVRSGMPPPVKTFADQIKVEA